MAAAGLSLKELKDILDDNELDLSARGLTAVPKAITQLPRATNIDFTSNKISFLLPELCAMTKIVKLDLGCNKLIFLPDNFGNLTSLQHLTLYNNEIENLPLSFSNLKSLKYLDLKRNPLVPELLKAAGPCNSEKECKQAAVNVVAHMKKEKLALEAQVAKQDKVNQKIAAANAEAKEAAKAKNNKEKKAQEPKKAAAPVFEPAEMASDKKQKKNDAVKQKQQPEKKQGSSILSKLIHYIIYAGLIVFLASSVNLFNDCYKYGGGQLVPGSKSFCTDMKKLTKFEKPSDKFFQHAKIAYGASFEGLRKGAVIAAEKVHTEAVVVYNNFDKYPIVKTVKSCAYKAHKEVTGVAFYVFTKAGDAYTDLCKWYETEGHKMVGVVVDPVVVALKMSYEIAKDLAGIAIDATATFLQRPTVYVESLLTIWQEKGFSAAVDAAFKH